MITKNDRKWRFELIHPKEDGGFVRGEDSVEEKMEILLYKRNKWQGMEILPGERSLKCAHILSMLSKNPILHFYLSC